MMSKSVLFLVPRDTINEEQRRYYSTIYPEIVFEFSDPYDPVALVRKRVNEGFEIVAGRGNTAATIQKNFPSLHVVHIQVTAYDVIRSLEQINLTGTTVAVITNNVTVSGLSIFKQLYSIDIISYLKIPFNKMESTINDAIQRGAKFVLGGALTCKMVNELRAPVQAIPLALGPESIGYAIHDIQQVQKAIEIENARQGFINCLLDSIDAGVISVDQNDNITLANSNAAKILQMKPYQTIGKSINTLLPTKKPNEPESLFNINGNEVLVVEKPVETSNNDDKITLYTLYKLSQIDSLKMQIRKQSFLSDNTLSYFQFSDIIGQSTAIKDTIKIAKKYAHTDSSVLIIGETGSGKELFAQSIHNESMRKNAPFIAINCAALPETLLESELFGYVEGAFTGANRKGRIGLFEAAHGGTIFLDEISELSYSSQGRLLRVLQEKYITRLGSQKIRQIDVRVIVATNKNLRDLVRKGDFRQDLYYRLNVLNLKIPPLRHRKKDAPILLEFFLNNMNTNVILDQDAYEFINDYEWYGNVREVRNLAERIDAVGSGPVVSKEDIIKLLDLENSSEQKNSYYESSGQPTLLTQQEKIANALKEAEGNRGKAAELLNIDRSTLWRQMKKYNML